MFAHAQHLRTSKRQVWTFLFNKGGVGKSTLSLITAKVLADLGYQVVFLDNDPQANSTQFFLNSIHQEAQYHAAYQQLRQHNIYSLLRGDSTLAQALIRFEETPIRLLGALPIYEEAKAFFRDKPKESLLRVKLSPLACDFLILDSPGELSDIANWSLSVADKVIIPVETEMFSVEVLPVTLERIAQVKQLINPEMGQVQIWPNKVMRKKTCRFALQVLERQYSEQLLFSEDGELFGNSEISEGRYLMAVDHNVAISNFAAYGIAETDKFPPSSKSYGQCLAFVQRLLETSHERS